VVVGDNLPVWTIEPMSGGVSLSTGDSYLGFSSSDYTWSVTAKSNGGFVFKSATRDLTLAYYSSGNYFGAYSSWNMFFGLPD
jgi:hypothetical protein